MSTPPPAAPAPPPEAPPQAAPPVVPPVTPPAEPPVVPPVEPPAVVPPPVVPPAPPAPAPAPETYELALPDGGALDQADLDAVAAVAKSKGWTNEQAQAAVEELHTSLTAQKQAFRTELDAHPEIGGPKFAAAQEHALRALDRFLPATSPEGQQFRTALNKSGYGEYAPMVLLLSRIGKAMSEDRGLPNAQGLGGGAKRSPESVLFGDVTKPSPSS